MKRKQDVQRCSNFKALASLAVLLSSHVVASAAHAQSFGSAQQAFNVQVTRIFSGQGTTYVQFSSLPGCAGNGGYLSVSWPSANGGSIDENRTKQIVATLLFAKGTGNLMEVRYRTNSQSPNGWDSCAIDSVYLN